MKMFLIIVFGSFSMLFTACDTNKEKNKKPNLIFVFVDQMRKHSLGFLNEDPAITPNLDEFAQSAQFLPNAISNVPICSPFRAMLMTGRYPLSTGITTNLFLTHNYGLSPKEETFGEVLRNAGYSTAYLGKWHLENPEKIPPRTQTIKYINNNQIFEGPGIHGFDYVLQTFEAQKNDDCTFWENSNKKIKTNWSVDFITKKALNYIQNRQEEKPFAVFISWSPPHSPFNVPVKFSEMYENLPIKVRPNYCYDDSLKQLINYFAGITWCDHFFGEILNFLKQENLEKNTIVVFTSDHGEMLGSHEIFNEKTYWYEESIKVPFLIRWPDKIPVGKNEILFPVHDIMPTTLGLMGIKSPKKVEGKNWSDNLVNINSKGPKSVFIAHYPYMAYEFPWVELMPRHKAINQGLIRCKSGYSDLAQLGFRGVTNGEYTYIIDRCPIDEPGISFNWKDWDPEMKYRRFGEVKIKELFYDNIKDPYQTEPIPIESFEYSNRIEEMKKELKIWLIKTQDSFEFDF